MKSPFRLPLWIPALAVAGVVVAFGWWGNQLLRRTVAAEVRSDLASTLQANVTALEIWATNQIKLATALAQESALRALALPALSSSTHPPLGVAAGATPPAEELSRHLRGRLAGLGYEIAHVVSTNLTVVATSISGQTSIGWTVADAHAAKFKELFALAKPVIITPFKAKGSEASGTSAAVPRDPRPEAEPAVETNLVASLAPGGLSESPKASDTLMQVAVPLQDFDGKIAGALALVIDPDHEFARILSVARAGDSGETYVFDQRGLMLSRSRYEDQLRRLGLIPRQPGTSSATEFFLSDPGEDRMQSSGTNVAPGQFRPLIRLVSNAVAERTGVDVEASRDYRGVPVVGAWTWLPNLQLGVVTQVDAEEAYRPLGVLNLVFAMLCLLLGLCASAFFVASYLGAHWRRRLSEAELKLKHLGQYTLEEKIGEGAMGIVYRARHALMRRETAVKLLLPERADPLSIKRFEREVQLTCQLAHPNTIQIYDYGHTPQGVFYCAMELLRGLNLQDLVVQFGPQLESRVIYILAQVCDSLAEAHALGLVHRDIKPANIFVCDRAGFTDWVKVLDFGLVRAFHDGKGRSIRSLADAAAEGTPLFMPPEAFADSNAADPRSDIYSLGAVGYYLLTGQYLFEAGSDLELYYKHLSEPPTPPSWRTSNPISPEIQETILRCLEKDRNLRVQSVVELKGLLLTSPAAGNWSAKDRTAWWTEYRLARPGLGSAGGTARPEAADGERTSALGPESQLDRAT